MVCSHRSRVAFIWLVGLEVAALVSLDVEKAYVCVEHGILLEKMVGLSFPEYITSWVRMFLTSCKFFIYQPGVTSLHYNQTRGLPQGSVLSPVLFNVLLSEVPVISGIQSYLYADDLAFYSSSRDLNSLL